MTETGFRSRCIRTHPSSTCLLRRLAFLPVCFFILRPCFRGFANSRITETHSILHHFRRGSKQKVPKNFFLRRLLSPRIQRDRQEARRVGNECDSTCRSRLSPDNYKKNTKDTKICI